MATAPTPKRGEVWLINFSPSQGAEIQKIRPAVVLNLDAIGKLPLRIVVPLTDWKTTYAAYPWMVHIAADAENNLAKDSAADAFQVKSVATGRFVRRLGTVASHLLDEIAETIAYVVGAP